eukprot:gene15356-18215_t
MVRDRPQFVLDCIGVSLYQVLYGGRDGAMDYVSQGGMPIKKKIIVRLFHFEPVLPLRKLKSSLVGKFVTVKGTVIRAGNVRPLVKSMDFTCVSCSACVTKHFSEGRVSLPTACSNYGCKGKNFDPIRSSAVTVDWQRIRIQEDSDQKDPKGGVPRNIECDLTHDLVESAVPGDTVTASGIIKVLKTEDGGSQQNKNKTVYYIYLDVNSIDSNKQPDAAGGKTDAVSFSLRDMYGVREIADHPNIFNLIVNSICPSIYGHELVKAGLTLALFGGNPRNTADRNKLPIRGDPHVLIVGDPGLGKSQMLKAFQTISPRGVYVSGGYTTRTGLTVSLQREAGTGDYALEAGALVLGDQGCCCIDEFDKMQKEHPALLEAMEQQSVSIAKAGIVCNLPARTSVIAAANPIGGHYNQNGDRASLLSRLIRRAGETFDPISPIVLRKYISYAKTFVQPKLSPEAIKAIQAFYLELRNRSSKQDSAPVTTRQLESLIRLSQARAKLEVREVVTRDDALDVIEIMRESLFETFEDEFGNIDFRRTSGMSKSAMVKKYFAILSREVTRQGVDCFSREDIYNIMKDNKLPLDHFDDVINILNDQGMLLRKGTKYRVLAY